MKPTFMQRVRSFFAGLRQKFNEFKDPCTTKCKGQCCCNNKKDK